MLGNICFQLKRPTGGSLPLILLFFIIPSFIVGCDSSSSSSTAPQLEQQFEAILVENMEEFGIPGALVGVSIPGARGFSD